MDALARLAGAVRAEIGTRRGEPDQAAAVLTAAGWDSAELYALAITAGELWEFSGQEDPHGVLSTRQKALLDRAADLHTSAVRARVRRPPRAARQPAGQRLVRAPQKRISASMWAILRNVLGANYN